MSKGYVIRRYEKNSVLEHWCNEEWRQDGAVFTTYLDALLTMCAILYKHSAMRLYVCRCDTDNTLGTSILI